MGVPMASLNRECTRADGRELHVPRSPMAYLANINKRPALAWGGFLIAYFIMACVLALANCPDQTAWASWERNTPFHIQDQAHAAIAHDGAARRHLDVFQTFAQGS